MVTFTVNIMHCEGTAVSEISMYTPSQLSGTVLQHRKQLSAKWVLEIHLIMTWKFLTTIAEEFPLFFNWLKLVRGN